MTLSKKTVLGLVSICFLACQQPKPKANTPAVDPKKLISCEGVGEVNLSFSYKDLKQKFGDKALTEHENNSEGKYTTLWEGKPQALNIKWEEKTAPFNRIKYIEVSSPQSPYLTRKGLRPGISLRDVVKVNGNMAVTFTNFYSKNGGGNIKSFNNGDIQKDDPCLQGRLELFNKRNINVNELKEFMSKKEVESFDRTLERFDIVLEYIRIYNK